MKKTRVVLLSFIIVVLILVFPQKVFAYDSAIFKMYYYDLSLSNDGSEDVRLLSEDFEFIGDFSMEAKAFIIYSNLFELEGVRFLPENTRLLSVDIADNTLFLNASREIRNMRGGAAQTYLLNQLAENAAQFGVSCLTLLVEGRRECLSEGIITDDICLMKYPKL